MRSNRLSALIEASFRQEFDELPASPPYGFWVDYNGGWARASFESHQHMAEQALGIGDDEDPDEVYKLAFTQLRWARLVTCEGKVSVNGHRLSNSQRRTIKDISEFYGLPVSYEKYVSAGEIETFVP